MNDDAEDTLCRLRNRLPEGWRGLLDALCQDQSVCQAELWLQTKILHSRSWDSLVTSLVALEPTVTSGSLQFQPVLLSLPRGVQVSLMAFLHLHRHNVSTTNLQNLVMEIQPFLEPGTWSSALHSLTAGSVEHEGTGTAADICSGKPAHHIDHGYTFSLRNTAVVSRVYQTLRTTRDFSPWQSHIPRVEKEIVRDGKRTNGSENMEGVDVMEVSASRPAEESVECIVIEDDSEKDSTQLSQSLAEVVGKTEELTAKADFPLSQASYTNPPSPVADSGDKSIEAKDAVCPMMVAAGRLREHWLGQESETLPPPEIKIFLTHSPPQVERLLQGLQLETFPDSAWTQMCKDVLALSPAISYSVLVLFFTHTVVPQFVELNQAAPRVLLTCLTAMAETSPKQLIDAICSGLKGRELNAAQSDLLTLLSKDKLTTESHLYLLQQLVTSEMGFSEQAACMLQGLLPQQGELEGSTVTALLSCLASAAPAMASSTQYGKLLLHLVSRLGKQLTGGQLSTLQLCVDCHKTFMKKSVTAAVKRLTK